MPNLQIRIIHDPIRELSAEISDAQL